jgi:hypothetical protein
MRQHYLMGVQMRKKLEGAGLLGPEYVPGEIHVRSTDVNRTIDSAYSQLRGLYPEESYPFKLAENQTDIGTPFNIDPELEAKINQDLGLSALPEGINPIPIEVPESKYDSFNPSGMCPVVGANIHN